MGLDRLARIPGVTGDASFLQFHDEIILADLRVVVVHEVTVVSLTQLPAKFQVVFGRQHESPRLHAVMNIVRYGCAGPDHCTARSRQGTRS